MYISILDMNIYMYMYICTCMYTCYIITLYVQRHIDCMYMYNTAYHLYNTGTCM